MSAILLALAASLAYGFSDFLGGLSSRSVKLLSVLVISQTTALILLLGNVIVRPVAFPDGEFVVYALLAGISGMIGTAAIYYGLAVGSMSIVAPVGAMTPLVPVVAGWLLGEVPTPLQWFGMSLAVAGVVLTSIKRTGRPFPDRTVAVSVLFGGISALGFGGSFVAMDAASEGGVSWALLVARLTAVVILLVLFVGGGASLGASGRELPKLALIGVFVVGADSMYAFASTLGLLGVVAVLSSVYPIVTVALARFYLHESIEPLQKVGIAACLSGVALTVL